MKTMTVLTLSNGQILDDYTACGIAEGFVEIEGQTEDDVLLAWSWIGKRKMYLWLQGWFGRTLRDLVENGYLDRDFNII